MAPQRDGTLVMEGAQIVFRNFAGKEGKYNREGDRNFCVLLEPEVARVMAEDGWNVKYLRAREGDEADQPYLQVSVGYKIRPPRIVLLTTKNRTIIEEDLVEMLDWVDIEFVDLTIRPYAWAVREQTGIKAYLKTMYVKIYEDPLDLKWAEVEELPSTAGRVRELEGSDHAIIEGEIV